MTPIEIVFSVLSLFISVFLFFLGRYMSRADKRGEAMQKGLYLILRGVKKTGQLAYANAVAIVNREINGEMEEAMQDYKQCMDDIDKHLAEQTFKK